MLQTKPGAQESKWLKFKEDITRPRWGCHVKAGKTGTSPGVPGLGFPCFHCRRHGFEPWLRNKDPPCQDSESEKKKTKDPELWDGDSRPAGSHSR